MKLELHCHSTRSDGTDPPRVVAARAAAAGVELYCLTDHDTWAGHEETIVAAAGFASRPAETVGVAPGMRVLRGTELSCDERGRPAHLLLYGLTEGAGLDRLAVAVSDLQRRRRERIAEICARFLRWDIHLDPEKVLAAAGEGTVGRPHVAAALVEAGVTSSVREAFDRFLRDGGPADVPGPRLPVEEGAALGRAAGARVSLAHPHSVGHPYHVRALFERARAAGLEGIEAVYGVYAQRERDGWLQLADELGLVVTAGSDYHGVSRNPDVPAPGMQLNQRRSERLLAWLA